MKEKVVLRIRLSLDVDLESFWKKAKKIGSPHLGYEQLHYLVTLVGTPAEAQKLIEMVEEMADYEINAYYYSNSSVPPA